MAGETRHQFREWFWRPPRAHGEVIRDRSVSFLELLYDLVYVAVIAQAAHHLAEDVSGPRVFEFATVFTLIWIAWINGTLYLELHGREDGRTRTFVFVQMGILALLAVFAGIAGQDAGGARFALVYVAFLLVQTWLWNSIRRYDTPEAARLTLVYVVGLLGSAAVMAASAVLAPEPRLIAWAVFGAAWIAAMLLLGSRSRAFSLGVIPTHSMVERFGLFIIIVLGEVVVGVVQGLTLAEQDVITIGTGVVALVIGLGLWWIYFDLVGRREPRSDGRALTGWMFSHLPVTLGIAAAGAAMVSLIEHAHDQATPEATAWLIGGSVALVLVGQIIHSWTLEDARQLSAVYQPLALAMAFAALAALALAALRPAPWLLALALAALLTLLWIFAVARFIRVGGWPPPA